MLAVALRCSVRARHHDSSWESASFCSHHASISASKAASEFDAGTLLRSVGFSQFTADGAIAAAVSGATALPCAPTATQQNAPIQSGINARIMVVISRG